MSDPLIIRAQAGGQIAEAVAQTANPRAFPSAAIDDRFGGIGLRDWFAGQALAGEMAAQGDVVIPAETLAIRAYGIADAMLAEREKGGAQ